MGQYLSTPIQAYDDCINDSLCTGTVVNAGTLPTATVDIITPTNLLSPNEAQFTSALSTYFGINVSHYNPVAVIILELPAIQAYNLLFSTNVTSPSPFCFTGAATILLNAPCFQVTPDGYLDLAFTISEYPNVSTEKAISSFLQAVASDLATVAKSESSSCLGCKPVQLLESNLQPFLNIGDITATVLNSDLSESGTLSSYTLFDLSSLPSRLDSAAATEFTFSGYAGKILSLMDALTNLAGDVGFAAATSETVVGSVLAGGEATLHSAQLVLTSFDIAVELLPQLSPSAQTPLYEWFETGVNIVTSFVDPTGAALMPTFFDSNGNLALGYDATTGSITYSGPDGILLPYGNGYLALLAESSGGPSNYSETLNTVGTAILPMPYSIRILSYNRNQPIQAYDGMLLGGNPLSFPIQFNVTNGALIPQMSLSPTLTVTPNGSTTTVTAQAFLNDGSLTTATNAFLIVNGNQSEMAELNASTFETTLKNNFPDPTPFMVYMISSNVPGGFASGVLGLPSGVQLSASLESFTLDRQNDQYVISIYLINNGANPAAEVMLTAAVLDRTATSTGLPISIGNLPYGASATVTLRFPIQERSERWHKWLMITETYSGGNALQSLPLSLPCSDK